MGGTKIPRISFGKAGAISLNQAACDLMEIKAKDKLTLAQDEEHPENWYLFKDMAHGFDIRLGYGKKGCLFNHAALVKTFTESMSLSAEESHSFLIAGQATTFKGDKLKYWGILIK